MPPVVDICNEAMHVLGADTITSLTENSKEARYCNSAYAEKRDAVLRAHPWNVAITRGTLAKDATAPAFGFDNQFTLPTNPYCLRVLSFWDNNVDNELSAYDSQVMFKIEGRKVLTNESECKITYIGRVIDTEQYDSLLVSALACRLAADGAYHLTGSMNVSQQMQSLYETRLREARGIDAMEGQPDKLLADDFVNIRF